MGEEDDKEKAEKVAAARKRYEQMKKDKAKKGTKKKGESTKSSKATEDDNKADEATDEPPEADPDEKQDETPKLSRADSLAQESRKRSESFRKASDSVSEDAKELHKKNAARIEELEKRNETLEQELATAAQETQHHKSDDASAKEIADLKSQLDAARRQSHARSKSTSTPDLNAQLAQKTSALESLELELSTLRHTLTSTEQKCADLATRAQSAEDAHAATEQRLADLKSTITTTHDSSTTTTTTAPQNHTETENRLALLTSDLTAAQTALTHSHTQIHALEAKTHTLTKLHNDAETQHSAQTRSRIAEVDAARAEIATLKRRLASTANENTRLRASTGDANAPDANAPDDAPDADDDESLTSLESQQTTALETRVRALEAENFALRRSVWRARRASLQPELSSESAGPATAFDDVDLSTPLAPTAAPGMQRGTANGVTGVFGGFVHAFNRQIGEIAGGGGGAQLSRGHVAGGSLEDVEFDEGAFAAASAAEGEARLAEERARAERVREVKRGLEGWRGWRVDLVDLRGGAMGGCFDV